MTTAVTKERLDAAEAKLIQAVKQKKVEVSKQEAGPKTEEVSSSNPGNILQLALTPETLLKLTGNNTKELVITINER